MTTTCYSTRILVFRDSSHMMVMAGSYFPCFRSVSQRIVRFPMPRVANRVKIKKKLVDSIRPPGPDEVQDRIIWDSEVPGFGLKQERIDGPAAR